MQDMVMCWPCCPNHASVSTHVEIIVPGMADSLVHNSTRRDISHIVISGAIGHEKPCVMALLCNNHCELGEPPCIKKLAYLNDLRQLNVQDLIKLALTNPVPENDNLFWFLLIRFIPEVY
uniref:AGO914 n=1 Tax=Arundo donax TaxID=35708 RepID=A0A0A9BJQ2_ARUDO